MTVFWQFASFKVNVTAITGDFDISVLGKFQKGTCRIYFLLTLNFHQVIILVAYTKLSF